MSDARSRAISQNSTFDTVYMVPLRDVIDLKSRGCRKLKRGNTDVPMYICLYEVRWCCIAAAAAVLLYRCCKYCAGVFEIQRKCGLESSSALCSGWYGHIRTLAYTRKHRSYLSQKKELEVWLLLYHVWPPQRQNLSLWCYTSTQHRTA